MSKALHMIRREIDLFREEEPWQIAHEEAMKCRDFEEFLAWFISFTNRLVNYDEKIRADVFTRRIPFDKSLEELIEQCFAAVTEIGERMMKTLEYVERDLLYKVEQADEFRALFAELQGIKAGDAHFCTEKLAQLEREAIEEYKAGRTVELGSDH